MTWLIVPVVVDDARRALLVEAGDPSRLPSAELPAGDPPEPARVLEVVEGLVGGPVVPLWVREVEMAEDEQSGVTVALAIADPERDTAAGRRFVGADAVVESLEPALVRPTVRRWLDRLDGQSDPRTPPWLDPAWYPRVSAWVAERMAAAGLPPTDSPRMVYQSPLGTILRTASGDRATFVKCSPAHFRAEAAIVRALAARTPDWVPEVIDVEAAEGWLLMADFGRRVLAKEPVAARIDGLGVVARLQRAWIGHTDELAAAHAQVRPLEQLIEALPGLLDVDGLGDRIAEEVRAAWPAALPRLLDACRELEAIGLPDSLVHGDLHPWNIAVIDGGLRVFDWSDGAVGLSFLDLAVFLGRNEGLDERRPMRDAYIEGWTDFAPRDRLERAAELAMAVGSIYQVVSYQGINAALPPEEAKSYAGADAGWVRRAVISLEHGLDAVFSRDG